jgi:uncharacterized protein YjbJ (UPF0337 family)
MKQMHKTMEDHPMNQDVFAGQWKQMRGELKSWWGKLADDDFDRIGGQKDKLIGLLQEKYGYARERAQQEVEQRLQEYGDKTGSPNDAPHAGAIATAVAAVAGGLESAEGAIATATTAVAGGLESASSYLQEQEFAAMATDLTALMRRYPVQSLLVGVGIGYVLARLTTR